MPLTDLTDEDRAWQWETLFGAKPYALLDRHPSGAYVALQASVPSPHASHVKVERAAIWDVRTRRVVWAPEGTNAVVWLPDGTRAIAVGESYKQPEDIGRRLTRTPYRSDFEHRCDLYDWPSQRLLASCELEYPTGWLIDLVCSPTGETAAFVWLDQTEAGFEFLDISDDHVTQADFGYYGEDSNLIQGPIFSPDGAFAVASYGGGVWWSEERHEPSPGGEFVAGTVVIADLSARAFHEHQVLCSVEPGWLPDDPDAIRSEMLSLATFISDRQFTVTTANGQTISVAITA